jgi:putative proteasome-type protease
MLMEGIENPETGETETLMDAPTMFQAAQRVGRAVRAIQNVEGKALAEASVDHDVAFLFGGQIKGGRLRLFMIYSAGNFIECTNTNTASRFSTAPSASTPTSTMPSRSA